MPHTRFPHVRRWSLRALAPLLLALCAGSPTLAAASGFYGRDLNVSGNATPLASHPNADAARDAFLAAITAPVSNNLDGDASNGSSTQTFAFGATNVTINASSGGEMKTAQYAGAYATSGTHYFTTYGDGFVEMRFTFSSPVSAFGCYITSLGDDLAGQTMRAVMTLSGGGTTSVDITSAGANVQSGGVAYFGLVNPDSTFTQVRFVFTGAGDVFGVDDLTIGTAGGGGGGGASGPPASVAEIGAYFLPKNVLLHTNTANPAKSTLRAVGTFDVGSLPDRDLSKPAAIDIGGLHVDAPAFTPNASGTRFTYKTPEFTFVVNPARTHSSKARFLLLVRRDMTDVVGPDATLSIHFRSADVDAAGSIALARGRYRVGLTRGTLFAPDISFYRLTATNKGQGKDSFQIRGAIASGGELYTEASDVTIEFAGYSETVPASAFTKKEDGCFVYGGALGGTIRKVQLDWRKERLIVDAAGLTFPTIASGASGDAAFDLRIVVGGMDRTAHVRVFRRGTKVAY